MVERELIDSVIIAENGALKTVASYYKGHLNLLNFANMNGEHVMGWTGPETRIVTKVLMARHIIEEVPLKPQEVVTIA